MATMNRARIMRVPVFGLSFVFLLTLAGIAESYYERMQAGKLVALVADMQVGYTTEADARKIAQLFSRYRDPHPDKDSAKVDSYEEYGFKNRAFAFLHIAPPKFLWVVIGYKNDVVAEKSVQYFEEPRCSGVVTETAQQAASGMADKPNPRAVIEKFTLAVLCRHAVFTMKVRDNLAVPSARRQLDWQIDLSCMTTIGGCRDPRKVLRGALLEPTTR